MADYQKPLWQPPREDASSDAAMARLLESLDSFGETLSNLALKKLEREKAQRAATPVEKLFPHEEQQKLKQTRSPENVAAVELLRKQAMGEVPLPVGESVQGEEIQTPVKPASEQEIVDVYQDATGLDPRATITENVMLGNLAARRDNTSLGRERLDEAKRANAAREKLMRERADVQARLAQDRLNFKKYIDTRPSAGLVEDIGGIDTNLAQFSKIHKAFKNAEQVVGVGAGRILELLQKSGSLTKAEAELRTLIKLETAQTLNSLGGKALTDTERRIYEEALPLLTTDPEEFLVRVNIIEDRLRQKKSDLERVSARTGRPFQPDASNSSVTTGTTERPSLDSYYRGR